jgi:ABC-type transport system involved in multi-copper enzyme maturation permease subunit
MNEGALASANRLAAIASATARETLRSRSMLVAVILNLLYLGLLTLIGWVLWTSGLDQAARALDDAGARESVVRTILFFGIAGASTLALFTGVFSSVGAVAGEIERGTILALAARPVARWEIVLGKFLGNGLLGVAYLVSQGLLIGLVVAALSGVWVTDLLLTLGLLSLNVLVMVALALAGSTRLTSVANGVAIVVLYLALTNTGLLFFLGTLVDSALLRGAADWSRLILPVGEVSDLAGRVLLGAQAELVTGAAGSRAGLPVHDWIWLYALGYLVVVLALGGWSLARRDLR